MVDLKYGEAADMGRTSFAFFVYGGNARVGHKYGAVPLPSTEMHGVSEPRKDYGDADNNDAPETGTYEKNIFTRLDRLRTNASENSITDQLERLQGIAALMQTPDQGPLPGELLRIYAWEIEDAADKLERLMKQE